MKKNGQRGNQRPVETPVPATRRWGVVVIWMVAGAALAFGIQSALKPKRGAAPSVQTLDPSRPLTFSKDIAPIIFENCSTCHRPGDAAPFSLLNFADVQKRARQIAEVTHRRLMPPWLPAPGYNEFVGQRSLSELQIAMIQRWVEQGAPEGNPAGTPQPPQSKDGWHLGPPDLVIHLAQPYALAADGKDVYRNFVVPVPTTARRYVRAVELKPGNPKAVHHAFMLVDMSGDSRRRDELDAEPGFPGLHTPPNTQTPAGHFMSWQPGKLPTAGPDELAWTLEPGTDFILQMHLRPTGKPELVRPSVGFYFSDKPPTKLPFKFGLWNYSIDIPAGETNYVVNDSYTLPVDLDVLRVLPHAHYLGRELRGWATLPDGRTQWLINIPRWDFNWQGDYAFQQPVSLPKGTVISMSYVFDNSTNNPGNPSNPPQRVKYGVNSSDEMAELWLQVLPRSSNDVALIENDYKPKVFRSTIAYNTYLLGIDPKNAKAHSEIGKGHLFLSQWEDAARFLRRSIELKPDEDEPHYYLGLLWRMTGRMAEAKSEFRATIQSNPNHYKAHGNLGIILLNEGSLADAELHLQSAVHINPDDVIARDGLTAVERLRAGKATP